MADTDVEKQGYSGFERAMFFMTPVLFTIVVLGILLILLNSDMRNQALTIGNSIPLLKDVLPNPQSTGGESTDETLKAENMTRKIAELQAQLTEKEGQLTDTSTLKTDQEKEIASLKSQIEQLKRSNATQALEDEAYTAKIKELASMYARIAPNKAAPILESMTLDEMVLVLDAMAPNDRVKILEKMTPKTAADATLKLKDTVSAKDLQIAALQSQLKNAQSTKATTTTTSSTLDSTQLGATFAAMDAKSAAKLLMTMSDVSASKVLRILNAVDDTTRSNIVGEMSTLNDKVTAQIVSKLMAGK